MTSRALPVTSVLELDVMLAVHAVRAVEFALGSLPGVEQVSVSRASATVRHDAAVTDDALIDAVALVGARVVGIARERRLPVFRGTE
jgi:copper chaperone CopZ